MDELVLKIGIGTSKSLQKNGSNYESIEIVDLFYRGSNVSFGVFYGGVIGDVDSFLESWNFKNIRYQSGASVEISFKTNTEMGSGTRIQKTLLRG